MIAAAASALLVAPIGAMIVWSILVHTTWTLESVLFTCALAFGTAWGTLVGVMLVLCSLVFLSLIEETGIKVYGRMNQRRITSAVAESICAHACIGWISGVVIAWLPWIHGWLTNSTNYMHVVASIFGLFAGLLHFEMLVWLGVRRCRYANREKPAQNPAPTP